MKRREEVDDADFVIAVVIIEIFITRNLILDCELEETFEIVELALVMVFDCDEMPESKMHSFER